MRSFLDISNAVIERFGGESALAEQLPKPKSARDIETIDDSRWLSEITRAIFQAGFSWKVVDNKWPHFEKAFGQFDVSHCMNMADEHLEATVNNKDIIRNWTKIKTVRDNALFLNDIISLQGSLGAYFAAWRLENFADNLQFIQKGGARLGGMSGQLFLRRSGVDTLVFSKDVLTALSREGLSGSIPKSKSSWFKLQDALNQWHAESGRSLNEISKILALSVG